MKDRSMRPSKLDPRSTLTALFLILALAGGCASHPSVSNVAVDSVPRKDASLRTADPEKIVLNGKLAKTLSIDQVHTKRVNGLLWIQMEVTNQSKRPVTFETRFEWFDADGLEVLDTTGHWAPRTIDGLASNRVGAVAPSDRAVTYLFHIRPDNS